MLSASKAVRKHPEQTRIGELQETSTSKSTAIPAGSELFSDLEMTKRPREGSNTAAQTPNKTASALALGNSLGNCVGDLQQIRTLLASLDASTLRQLLDGLE